MRKINVIIMTALTAALLLTGCGNITDKNSTSTASGNTNVSSDSISSSTAETVVNSNVQESVNGKQCPYCGLVYEGDDVDAYNAHIAACEQSEG